MSKKVFGVALIALGFFYLADAYYNFNIDLSYIFRFWPVILIFFGIKEIVKKNNVWGMILIFFGIYFLLPVIGIDINIREYIFPLLLIIVGVALVLSKNSKQIKLHGDEKIMSYTASFNAKDLNIDSSDVEVLKLNVKFGSIDVRFRNTTLHKNLTILVNGSFSSIGLALPEGYKLVVKSDNSFSTVNNTYKENDNAYTTIFVENHSSFNSIDIR